ncbi:50S ribosomal protein L9 [Alphaproteobacteria bacterium endosymbiont of Tiliacea citrago]|uniref:50S ribosomal protein L9 n=1 Tax=Alphaproteobacteria bacterium endosymbiont of Tiliacea citrago TaxID=3077944 RepID=UPI00313D2759
MKRASKKVQCVLKQPIRGKGGIGDVINARRGFARYLERFNKAERATKEVLNSIDQKKEEWKKEESLNLKNAEEILNKLKKFNKISFVRRVSHSDTLYASLKQDEIIEFFKTKGVELTKQNIKIDKMIKTLGEHSVIINIYGDLEHSLIVEITKGE